MGVDAREFPGGLLRLNPAFAYDGREFKIILECEHDSQVSFLKCRDEAENGDRMMA